MIPSQYQNAGLWRIWIAVSMDFLPSKSNGKSWKGQFFAVGKPAYDAENRTADFRKDIKLQTRKWKSRAANQHSDWKSEKSSRKYWSEGVFPPIGELIDESMGIPKIGLGLFPHHCMIWDQPDFLLVLSDEMKLLIPVELGETWVDCKDFLDQFLHVSSRQLIPASKWDRVLRLNLNQLPALESDLDEMGPMNFKWKSMPARSLLLYNWPFSSTGSFCESGHYNPTLGK